ncbi:MAG: SDR family NAD(P)-dependent oxidoreductase, partial [Nitrospirae bacterium]|nr:SDR family NAD(P)-dependent oxidoreductase [Nitrospirota bacterium]
MKSHLKHKEKGTASSPRVVLITGASRGLGRAMALRFSRGGCIIAVNYFQSKDAALETVRSIMEAGGEADSFYGDVRLSQDVTSMIKLVYERWDSIEVLIN